jgi:hypothetical protein
MKHEYRIWQVGSKEPVVVGTVTAEGYLEARQKAEQLFGEQIEVYLIPAAQPKRSLAEVLAQLQPQMA